MYVKIYVMFYQGNAFPKREKACKAEKGKERKAKKGKSVQSRKERKRAKPKREKERKAKKGKSVQSRKERKRAKPKREKSAKPKREKECKGKTKRITKRKAVYHMEDDKKLYLFEQAPVPKAVMSMAVPTVISSLVKIGRAHV